jgi:predicted metalloprotease with PDZ domain
MAEDGPEFRVLRHKPNARITVSYRIRTAYDADPHWRDGLTYQGAVIRPDWFAFFGDIVFILPEGRERQPATFRWGRMPRDWTVASDLDHGAQGQPLTLDDIRESVAIGGAQVRVAERKVTGGVLRVASLPDRPFKLDALADQIAATVSAERAFWGDGGPYFVGVIPLVRDTKSKVMGGIGRSDGFALWSTPDEPELVRWTVAHENMHTWIPGRVGQIAPSQQGGAVYWFTEGFTDFFTNRAMLRAGVWTVEDVVTRLDETLKAYDANPARDARPERIKGEFFSDRDVQRAPYQRGQLLALKWDEDIRKKTGGKADLDDVILRMRDHYRQFRPGEGPDVVTGLVSAAWVVAGLDLRPDIARYADGGVPITFPETLFDGCLDARVTVSPGFDSGFDHAASVAAKVVKGVRRRGPAWNSGLRDGMRLDGADLRPGDMTREIVLTVRPANDRGRAKTIRYWPYGDNDVEARTFQLAMGLTGDQLAACGHKLGGS